jgi:hypothetical protein
LSITASVISGRQEGLFSWFGLLEKIVQNEQAQKIFGTSADTNGKELRDISEKIVYYEQGGASSQIVFTLP